MFVALGLSDKLFSYQDRKRTHRRLTGSLPRGGWSTDAGASPRVVGTASWLGQIRGTGFIWPESLELEAAA